MRPLRPLHYAPTYIKIYGIKRYTDDNNKKKKIIKPMSGLRSNDSSRNIQSGINRLKGILDGRMRFKIVKIYSERDSRKDPIALEY